MYRVVINYTILRVVGRKLPVLGSLSNYVKANNIMEFNQLKYVVEIVEAGSISKAANNLFISQPNLSMQIVQLEKELGRVLFIRGNRGVTLTKDGLEVYHHAKQVVNTFELTEHKLLNHISENKIKVASCGCEVIEPAFIEVCKIFNQDNYEFELEYCNTEQCIEKVASQEVDLAVIPYTEMQYKKLDQVLVNKSLYMQRLFTGELKVHVSDRWELSKKKVIHPSDLRDLFHVKKHILFDGMFSLDYDIRQMGIDPYTKTIITHQSKTYENVLSSMPSFGITLEWHCNKEVNRHLKRIPLALPRIPIIIAMIRRQNEMMKKEINYFLEQLEQYKN